MIKITLKGGLGNQMFQYAHGRNLSIQNATPLLLDLSEIMYKNSKDTSRDFKLDVFNIQANIYKPSKKPYLEIFFNKILNKLLDKEQFFQSEKYFRDIEDLIRKEFTLKDPLSKSALELINTIKFKKNAVSVHIRRGDYANNPKTREHHGLCPIDYYEKSIKHISSKIDFPTFFVFSDDITWVKENLKIDAEAIFVSNPEILDYEELILMSKCSHHIIANSSFSWWGAWLNPNPDKIVIAPKQWLKDTSFNASDVCPSEWIRI